jgi:hypothetical protein
MSLFLPVFVRFYSRAGETNSKAVAIAVQKKKFSFFKYSFGNSNCDSGGEGVDREGDDQM